MHQVDTKPTSAQATEAPCINGTQYQFGLYHGVPAVMISKIGARRSAVDIRRSPARSDAAVCLPERVAARAAAAALRRAIADPSTMGAESMMHIDLCRPRRGVWLTSWANLPGLHRSIGAGERSYTHDLLPGWQYARHEIRSEMIPDLEALAEHGVRPTEATSA